MIRPTIETREVKIPSGITVTLKNSRSYGDDKKIDLKAMGEVEVSEDTKVTYEQAVKRITATLEVMIVDWDVTEEDGTKLPVNEENIEAVLTAPDVDYILNEIGGAKKK